MTAAPLRLHRETVRPEWIDYNGHLSEAYYVLIFGHATDAFYDHIGLDDAARRQAGVSVYTLEAHISYLHEVGPDAELAIETLLLDLDAKRMHIFHRMLDGERVAAEEELMLLHVDMTGPKAAPFAPEVVARLQAIRETQAGLPRPARAGRAIGLKR